MQDRKVHEREEALVDLGWQRMAALLATEMPVAPAVESDKRRGLLWFWWLALAGLLIVGASLHFALSKPAAPVQPATPQPAPAMAQTDATPREPAAALEPVAADVQTTIPTMQGAPASKQARNLLTPRFASSAVGMETPAVPAFAVQLNETVPFSSHTSIDNTAVPPAMTPVSPGIPGAPLAALDVPKATPEWTMQPVRRLSKKLRFGAELALGGDVSKGINSFATGPVAEWKPGKRMAVQSGLLLGATGYGLEPARNNSRSNDPDPTAGFSSATQEVAASISNGSNWNLRLRSLQVPVIASYQITPRIRFESGLTSARVWIAGNTGVNADVENFSNVGTANQYDQLQLERAVGASVAQWEWVASAGVQYRITPNAALRLHYQHGLNDLLTDSSLQARQRGWRMSGLAYF